MSRSKKNWDWLVDNRGNYAGEGSDLDLYIKGNVEKGEDGVTGDKGDKGNEGDKGQRGAVGPEGKKGEEGHKGSPGGTFRFMGDVPTTNDFPDDAQPGDVWRIEGTDTLYVYTGTDEWILLNESLEVLEGIKGVDGEKGVKGDEGTKGLKGETVKGEKGEKGLDGAQGTKGQKGLDGASVKGQKGSSGASVKGQKGQKGVTGSTKGSFIHRGNVNVSGEIKIFYSNGKYYIEGTS